MIKKQKGKYLSFISRPGRDRENVCENVEKFPCKLHWDLAVQVLHCLVSTQKDRICEHLGNLGRKVSICSALWVCVHWLWTCAELQSMLLWGT